MEQLNEELRDKFNFASLYEKLEQKKPALLQAYLEMEQGIHAFTELITVKGVEKALILEIAGVEPIPKESEPEIHVTTVINAAQKVKFVLNNYYGSAAEPRKNPKKVAGFVKVNMSADELDMHLTRINAAKNKIRKTITSITNSHRHVQDHLRFYFLHSICNKKSCIPSEIYRNIPYSTSPIDRVSILWDVDKANNKYPKAYLKEKGVKKVKKHNTLPVFLANNSPLAGRKGTGEDVSVTNGISS